MHSIESLLPHRPPFLFVDEILECTPEAIVGIKTFDERDAWLKGEFNYVPSMILMESMAQCGGAGVRLLGIAKGTFGLANIESVEFYEGIKFGEKIKYVIRNLRVSDKVIRQCGVAYLNEMEVMKANWMSVKLQ